MSIKALEYFENYFEIPYGLDKLDIAVVPNLLPTAMENWGLILFDEMGFQSNEIAKYLAHEIAHQVKKLLTKNFIYSYKTKFKFSIEILRFFGVNGT